MLQHIGNLRRCFAQGAEREALSDVLSTAVLERAVEEEVGVYRERIDSPLVTLSMFVSQNQARQRLPEGWCSAYCGTWDSA